MRRMPSIVLASILAVAGAWCPARAAGPAQTAPASAQALQVTYYFIPG